MSGEVARFAGYVATLGRGPGRSRALTAEEAQDAMALLLRGVPDPVQIGAFLMLLRYRGEDPDEITGLVRGAQPVTRVNAAVDLDWPSYGAGRSRGAPWFLLAALALADAGVRVLMHGSNEFSAGMSVREALAALGRPVAASAGEAARLVESAGFAYVPVEALSARFAELLGLRRLLGLRSPVNTVARLLDPAGARAGVDGVFHPPYIETHLAAAERLGRPRLLVVKGGGGEAERNPFKPVAAYLWTAGQGRAEQTLPALRTARDDDEPDIVSVWRAEQLSRDVEARIIATIELALLALSQPANAAEIWHARTRP